LEFFHFSRITKKTEPPPLGLRLADSTILKPKDIWYYLGFFFNKKLLLDTTFVIILTRAWKCLAISQEDYIQYTNIYYTELVYFLSCYIDSNHDISNEPQHTTPSRSWRKCKEEQPYELQRYFIHYHYKKSKLLSSSFQSIFILINSYDDTTLE